MATALAAVLPTPQAKRQLSPAFNPSGAGVFIAKQGSTTAAPAAASPLAVDSGGKFQNHALL